MVSTTPKVDLEMTYASISLATSLSSRLRSCASLSALRAGQQAHAQVLAHGLLPHVTLETDLMLTYARCSNLPLARQVFDRMRHRNMHSWNILLSAYVQASLFDDALSLPRSLLHSGLRPDHFTLPSLLKASAAIGDSFRGMTFHNWAVCLGHEENVIVRSSILDMYAKCGSLDDALYLFETMPNRDIVMWNSIISGYARVGCSAQALDLFRRSQWEVEEQDFRAIPSVLNACGREGDLRRGQEVHGRAVRCCLFDSNVAVGNSLIDMYAKCGCANDSCKVFSSMGEQKNIVTWSTLISCYGVHGERNGSLALFEEMLAQGMKPNHITFTSVLSSCSHSGLVEEGRRIFDSIRGIHEVEPSIEHYACLVDLIGRSGNVEEALEMIHRMPMEPTASVWGALLGACVVHKNVEVGEIAAFRLFDLEARNPSNYVALCGIYEAVGRLDCVAKVRVRMKELEMVKTPGCSWIDVKGRLQAFYQGDVSHPSVKHIHEMLNWLTQTMTTSTMVDLDWHL
nr:PREDICTED: pentatricopeptide repeat-containing protein At5g04780-like [Musa acuminata subsp. malaccensis]XP_018679361.1 PREDICTED: pentatricopeptide repeat-containing protein At5g04780-like [Musa acuminata subsp. malaccensis]XP_018679362.1 PREDICTED: pentatricopeptide repeat-containing protein At5g04780-like [Musa acuminata subsp. malaccensis]XP_018679363.1 PREDICTED: pentatricopeptide repeat-containing protein At5g04780-like [Musa acuminata subsp. malaccensis]XP_018679364.1 PREDICTED: penta